MEPIPASQVACPFCLTPVDATVLFCPTCGKNLKEKPLSTSITTQIGLYAVSILLPPLFIGWTIKYVKSGNPKAKQIGYISLGLTIVSLIIAIWVSITLTKSITREIDIQLQQYQGIGL